jgi:hypothetical protein
MPIHTDDHRERSDKPSRDEREREKFERQPAPPAAHRILVSEVFAVEASHPNPRR